MVSSSNIFCAVLRPPHFVLLLPHPSTVDDQSPTKHCFVGGQCRPTLRKKNSGGPLMAKLVAPSTNHGALSTALYLSPHLNLSPLNSPSNSFSNSLFYRKHQHNKRNNPNHEIKIILNSDCKNRRFGRNCNLPDPGVKLDRNHVKRTILFHNENIESNTEW